MYSTQEEKEVRKYDTWEIDQSTKSQFFHQKLHEYGLLRIAYQIEEIQGEKLEWDKEYLNISELAWKKIIHKGIKPVRIFAHPEVLVEVERAVGYYQKLAMVSLKSMSNIGLNINRYEAGENRAPMSIEKARKVSKRLNKLISMLIEFDEHIDVREFDLWRGMTAGSSAQGSWQNAKGDRAETVVKGLVRIKLKNKGLIVEEIDKETYRLKDGRRIEFGAEPDIALYKEEGILDIAVEIKGGIDPAGVLERIGAAIKSLSRAKQDDRTALTILVLPKISMTSQAEKEIEVHDEIDYSFFIEDIINDAKIKQEFLALLRL